MSKICCFFHFLGNAIINVFDFLYDHRSQYCAASGLGVKSQKNNSGISRGLSVKKSGFFLHFHRNATTEFFYFLNDDRGQH